MSDCSRKTIPVVLLVLGLLLTFTPRPGSASQVAATLESAWTDFNQRLARLETVEYLLTAPAAELRRHLLSGWSPRQVSQWLTFRKTTQAEVTRINLEMDTEKALRRIILLLPAPGPQFSPEPWNDLRRKIAATATPSHPGFPWLAKLLDRACDTLAYGIAHQSGTRVPTSLPQSLNHLRDRLAAIVPGKAMAADWIISSGFIVQPSPSQTYPALPVTIFKPSRGGPAPAPTPGGIASEPFLWGVSTAGYQWEGGNDGSIWTTFEGKGKTEHKAGQAANGLEWYETDVKLAADMGLNVFRTSIEWSRIEPVSGTFDPEGVAFYHRLFQCIRRHGMRPLVTLIHFSWPQWMETGMGGWTDERGVRAFQRYVDFVSREYGAEVDWWITFNEPPVVIIGGYLLGKTAPGYANPLKALAVSRSWIRCHKLAYRIIHQNDAKAYVSWNNYTGTYQFGPFGSLHFSVEGGNLPGQAADAGTGDSTPAAIDDQWQKLGLFQGNRRDGEKTLDFIGIDYYCRWQMPGGFTEAPNWEPYPEGFYQVIKNYYQWFKVPVLIVENGMATKDLAPRADGWTREAFLVQHVKEMQRARRDGIPVLGYIHWSITDNYEWGSFSPRFGLYSVDCLHGNFERVPTPAVEVYRKIATSGGVTSDLLEAYPGPTKPGKKVSTPGR